MSNKLRVSSVATSTSGCRRRRLHLVWQPYSSSTTRTVSSRTRSNLYVGDLMRNAPIDAMGKAPFLVGGHRISRHLPWYRGKRGEPMEPEAQAVIRTVREKLFSSPFSMSLDCHSGFGRRDRVWCCYARSHRPIPHIAEVYRCLLYTSPSPRDS